MVMFLEILKTLVQVLVVFSILIIAFGLAFYILLSRDFSYLTTKRASTGSCNMDGVRKNVSVAIPFIQTDYMRIAIMYLKRT